MLITMTSDLPLWRRGALPREEGLFYIHGGEIGLSSAGPHAAHVLRSVDVGYVAHQVALLGEDGSVVEDTVLQLAEDATTWSVLFLGDSSGEPFPVDHVEPCWWVGPLPYGSPCPSPFGLARLC